jgi:predicted O-methyltransferase YrrM
MSSSRSKERDAPDDKAAIMDVTMDDSATVSGPQGSGIGRRPAGMPTTRVRQVLELPGKILRSWTIERRFRAALFPDRSELRGYERELRESGLVDHLHEQRRYFLETTKGVNARGVPYILGTINEVAGGRLYAVIRKFRPQIAVETGVCAGFSTSFILQAMQKNGSGYLHSIDLPEVVGEEYREGVFWEGKGGAAAPPGKSSGWAVPEPLKPRWELTIGKTQEQLPPLLDRLGTIDFFMHDSEHSYECMMFEFVQAYDHLRAGGVLMTDDTKWNDSFFDFAKAKARRTTEITKNVALLVK